MTLPPERTVYLALILLCATLILFVAIGGGSRVQVAGLDEGGDAVVGISFASPVSTGLLWGWLFGSEGGCTEAEEEGFLDSIARMLGIPSEDCSAREGEAFWTGPEEGDALEPALPISADPLWIIAFLNQKQIFGAEPNPTGNPIGGGEGYAAVVVPVDSRVRYPVRTAEEFLAALREARAGDVVYIDESASISLAGVRGGATIPAGVTVASNRGAPSSAASAIFRFATRSPGEYSVWGCVLTDSTGTSGLRVSLDRSDPRLWHLEAGSEWRWVRQGSYRLLPGNHALALQWQDDGVEIDRILITSDPEYDPGSSAEERGGMDYCWIEAESGMRFSPLDAAPHPAYPDRIALFAPDDLSMTDPPVSTGGRIVLGEGSSRSSAMLIAGGEGVRITGLVIEGPDTTTGNVGRALYGIESSYRDLEVDNCEIFGWSGAGISVRGTSGAGMKSGGFIHHNSIHHCQADGLGYGLMIAQGGASLAEANFFDYCRHAIAGTGDAGNSYEVRYNIFGPNFPQSNAAHVVDMHGYSSSSGNVAGDRLVIHHNTFEAISTTDYSIAVRGIPETGAYIENNWFQYTGAPIGRTGVTSSEVDIRMYIGTNKGPSGAILATLQQRIISTRLS